ncbi:MAG: TetR/AcrR family transcriptional regulator [Acetobacteraceae bacterium]|nr:TetR/AcrR family transcriptional regulator [Acetobacteraceae bacterium]
MRRSAEAKAETRRKILEAAGALFRSHGVEAVGVDAIMHRAGLTHGGFYGHFPSKEALVTEASAASLARAAAKWDRISREKPPRDALAEIVGSYLDPSHVAAVERGCVLATIGSEMARRPGSRSAIADSVNTMISALARCMPDRSQGAAQAVLACMVGAVMLARLTGANSMLEGAKAQVLSCRGNT